MVFRKQQFITFLLVTSLMSWQLASSYAQSSSGGDDQTETTAAAEEQASAENIQQNEEDVYEETGEFKVKHGNSEDSLTNIINAVMVIAIAYIGMKTALACTPTAPSFWAFYAGALIYLYQEIAVNVESAESDQEIVGNYEDEDHSYQIGALESAAKMKRENAKKAQEKSIYQAAAAAAFYTGGGLAMSEGGTLESLHATCTSTNATSIGATMAVQVAMCACSWTGACATCCAGATAHLPLVTASEGAVEAMYATIMSPGSAYAYTAVTAEQATSDAANIAQSNAGAYTCAAAVSSVSAYSACFAFINYTRMGYIGCPAVALLTNPVAQIDRPFMDRIVAGNCQTPESKLYSEMGWQQQLAHYLQDGINFIVPEANAALDFKSLGVGAGIVLILFWAATKIYGMKVANMIGNPWMRGTLFFIFGALATVVAAKTFQSSKKMKDQAEDFQQLADKLRALDKKRAIENKLAALGSTSTTDTVALEKAEPGDYSFENATCFEAGSNANSGSGVDLDCSCQATNSCSEIKLDKPQLDQVSQQQIGPEIAGLTASAGVAVKAANSLAQGKADAARVAVGSLASGASRIKKQAEKVFDNVESRLKLKGINPGLRAIRDNTLKGIRSDLADTLAKNGGAEVLAQQLNTDLGAAKKDLAALKKGNYQEEKVEAFDFKFPTTSTATTGFSLDTPAANIPSEEMSVDELRAEMGAGYVTDEATEIFNNDSVSIFEKISQRYLRSIPKLLRKKKKPQSPISDN